MGEHEPCTWKEATATFLPAPEEAGSGPVAIVNGGEPDTRIAALGPETALLWRSLPQKRLKGERTMSQLRQHRRAPGLLFCDNGSEFTGSVALYSRG